ncbi:MAG: hypothetical protein NTU44_14370 [Bacteroidetes bacterium]|nr:hypothetical protein [Bacteroidota bacterium]
MIRKVCLSMVMSIVLLLSVMSCKKDSTNTNSLYTPTLADTTATATLAELQQGRQLYIDNCGKCHTLYNPDSYSATQWKAFISNMAPKTNLTSSEITLVSKYVCRGK